MSTFRKHDSRPGRIAYEVAGLRWLSAAGPQAVPIVPVLDHGPDWLEEPRLTLASPTPQAAENFGRELAHLHATGLHPTPTPHLSPRSNRPSSTVSTTNSTPESTTTPNPPLYAMPGTLPHAPTETCGAEMLSGPPRASSLSTQLPKEATAKRTLQHSRSLAHPTLNASGPPTTKRPP